MRVSSVVWLRSSIGMHVLAVHYAELWSVEVCRMNFGWCWWLCQTHPRVDECCIRLLHSHCQMLSHVQRSCCLVENCIYLIVHRWSVLSRCCLLTTDDYGIGLVDFQCVRLLNVSCCSATLCWEHFLVLIVVWYLCRLHTWSDLLYFVCWWGIFLSFACVDGSWFCSRIFLNRKWRVFSVGVICDFFTISGMLSGASSFTLVIYLMIMLIF